MTTSLSKNFSFSLANELALLSCHKALKSPWGKKWYFSKKNITGKKLSKKQLPRTFKGWGIDMAIGLAINGACHGVRSGLSKLALYFL
jgi:hypothetical protein